TPAYTIIIMTCLSKMAYQGFQAKLFQLASLDNAHIMHPCCSDLAYSKKLFNRQLIQESRYLIGWDRRESIRFVETGSHFGQKFIDRNTRGTRQSCLIPYFLLDFPGNESG